jgi:outer membrane protein TolC
VTRLGNLILLVALLSNASAPNARGSADIEVSGQNSKTLVECVELALLHSPNIAGAVSATEEATAERLSARGKFGPVVSVQADALRWDSEFALPISLNTPDSSLPLDVLRVDVRDDTTAAISLSVLQPVTGLWTNYEAHRALTLGEDGARHHQRATQNDVVLAVAEAYLDALEAKQMIVLAEVLVRTREGHIERTRRFLESGVVARNNLLEAEVRLAKVRARLIDAEGLARLARANLAFQIGLPADQEVWPADLPVSESTAAETMQDDKSPGFEERPELATAKARTEQAQTGVNVATARMIPQINAVFNMKEVEGVHVEPSNAWFVGAQLRWNIWEWGSTYYAIDAARARARQAEAAEGIARESLRLEALHAEIDLDIARAQLRVSRTAVEQAGENLRIVEQRFAQQAGTSTDVLDAQSLHHDARAREASAEYALLRAEVRWRRARGLDPVAISGKSL